MAHYKLNRRYIVVAKNKIGKQHIKGSFYNTKPDNSTHRKVSFMRLVRRPKKQYLNNRETNKKYIYKRRLILPMYRQGHQRHNGTKVQQGQDSCPRELKQRLAQKLDLKGDGQPRSDARLVIEDHEE